MDMPYVGKKIVAVVVQRPFNSQKGDSFCKLAPLFECDEDEGTIADNEFYNDGEIIWKLATTTTPKTVFPGALMEIVLEESPYAGDSAEDTSWYQARPTNRADILDGKCGAEIFFLPDETEKSLCRFKGDGATVRLPHLPSRVVFLRVSGCVYGPFSTQYCGDFSGTEVGVPVQLKPFLDNKMVYKIDDSSFGAQNHYAILSACIAVSANAKKRRESNDVRTVSYEYLTPKTYDKMVREFGTKWIALDFESLSAKVSHVVNSIELFSRPDRQRLNSLIQQLQQAVTQVEDPNSFLNVLNDVESYAEKHRNSIVELAKVMMDNGLLDDERIRAAEQAHLKDWISTQTKAIGEALATEQGKLEDLRQELKAETSRFELERQRQAKTLQEEAHCKKNALAMQLKEIQSQIDREKKGWNEERQRLSEELDKKQRLIDQVLLQIQDGAEKNAASLISLYPFLKHIDSSGSTSVPEATCQCKAKDDALDSGFPIPEILLKSCPVSELSTTQNEFLTRLSDYAEYKGLSYDPEDLRRFHFSVLCEGITVLGGPSGVGKSSLARLYGDILAGAAAVFPRDGTHVVRVNPSWIERADMLGFVNTVTGEFVPSETGLYQRLIYACSDYKANYQDSALYPICLDEMNLAQVEHYFSDFMQIMEDDEKKRILPCFSKEAVRQNAVFRSYSSIEIAPTVKFIGTVNFDETTRRLSSRLLDRVNLISLRDDVIRKPIDNNKKPDIGPGVSYATYVSWLQERSISPRVAECIDKNLSPLLRKLDVAISPRVRTAMGKYIASYAAFLGDQTKAENIGLDEQVAQRVLSKVRTVSGRSKKEALNALCDELSKFCGQSQCASRTVIEKLIAGYDGDAACDALSEDI